ncbi:MAG: hypothetical protein WC828_04620 [Thermoleophilia bacterium]|jgi:hypothetical protein
MDIQELVDSRIAEIQSRATGFSKDDYRVEFDDSKSSRTNSVRNVIENNKFSRKPNLLRGESQDEIRESGNMSEVIATIDHSLARIAEKMLDVTDLVASDYSRLENDLLKSRLAVLLGAESVLDMAVTLREKALLINSEFVQMNEECTDDEEYVSLRQEKGRASMHSHGVAALFRKT